MKKKLLIALGILLVIVIGVLVYVAASANRIIAKYKPEIETQLSSILGSKVQIGVIDVSVFPSITAVVKELSVQPAKGQGLTLNNFKFGLDLFPLLTGKIVVSEVLIDSPSITVTKLNGKVIIPGVPEGGPQAAPVVTPKPATPAASEPTGPSGGPALPSILNVTLRKFTLKNAAAYFDDKDAKQKYSIDKVNVGAGLDVSGGKVLLSDIEVSARALEKIDLGSKIPSITLDPGQLSVVLPKGSASFFGNEIYFSAQGTPLGKLNAALTDGTISLATFSKLSDLAPILKSVALSGSIKPKASVEMNPGDIKATASAVLSGLRAEMSPLLLRDLGGTFNVDAAVKKEVSVSVTSDKVSGFLHDEAFSVLLKAGLEGSSASLSDLTFDAFGGQAKVAAKAILGDAVAFQLATNVKGMDLARAGKAAVGLDLPVTGRLETFTLQVGGATGPQMLNALSGKAGLLVKDGSIKGYNILGEVLGAVKGLPFMSGSLADLLPAELRGELSSPDTKLGSVSGDYLIAGGKLRTANTLLESPLFSLAVSGEAAFEGQVNLDATLRLSLALTTAIVAKQPDLRGLVDREQRMVIPVTILGKMPKFIIVPNIPELLKTAAGAKLQQEAGKVLGKLLGGKKFGF